MNGHHGQRARRGAAAHAVLLILEDGPRHGYELITEIEARSNSRWRPSPGSMYPTLARLEGRGLIAGTDDDDGTRRFELTDAGRSWLSDRDGDGPKPWDETGPSGGGRLRPLVAEIGGQIRQIGRFGTDAQRSAAIGALERTRDELYRVLAERPDPSGDTDSSG